MIKRTIIIFCTLIFLAGCSDKAAQELYDIAQLEERQHNNANAIRLYQEVAEKYADSEYAGKAKARLAAINKKPSDKKGAKAMTTASLTDYSQYDRSEILQFIFHPRPEASSFKSKPEVTEFMIPVAKNVEVGARFYPAKPDDPVILFFHGNGEIVADYDDLAPFYTKLGINFFPVDFRGYGRSTGTPSVTAMIHDSHKMLIYAQKWLGEHGYTGPLIVMGRSLGSASALEIAAHYEEKIDGLIIESGFAYALPLLKLLGINTDAYNLTEEQGFRNLDKIRNFKKPTLVIHAKYDHIIPFGDGQALFDASPAAYNKLLKIPKANHNNIFSFGMQAYLEAVKALADAVSH
ncbi:alpha/beta fold hydrolase [Desulfococcaceae bacterium HSG9]|nr:alpha/beta fold hydrolase [Desulfococcaceae bacterium HSG9]